ncbi:hypothetical protein GCM10011357_15840 [Lacimicrobium alkaliphilum]|uniref:Uncharacterized protein n=1 Tax=Lacimicrobium alkaliphilum TaxID=1526571 RepID=A0ABQ1R7L4_9ALTE|nr:hypothetical protein GCM10011357_15840 [Lacimicrobium alkaliphilum]
MSKVLDTSAALLAGYAGIKKGSRSPLCMNTIINYRGGQGAAGALKLGSPSNGLDSA